MCACHHRCEWTCSLLPIPVGLLLENNLCVLVQGSCVCMSRGGDRGTLTDHVRQQNCRLLGPSCHQAHLSGRWPYLQGTVHSSSCWGITRERLPDEAARSCSPAPHDSVCFSVNHSHGAVMKRGEATETRGVICQLCVRSTCELQQKWNWQCLQKL